MKGIVIQTVSFFLIFNCAPNTPASRFSASSLKYPADGISQGRLELKISPDSSQEEIIINENDSVVWLGQAKSKNGQTVLFRSKGHPGRLTVRTSRGRELTLVFDPVSESNDLDSDGFPDVAELRDEDSRRTFRLWFVRIALSQNKKKSAAWNTGEQDCAGLIRFAYREALKRHDSKWREHLGYMSDSNTPDLIPFYYPAIPVIKDRIFQIHQGSAMDASTFGRYASASVLMNLNTRLLSRDMHDALPGDLLFFSNSSTYGIYYHSMIVLEQARGGSETVVLYHTGNGGMMKRAPVSYLALSPIFHPIATNPDFLGVYRFRILE